MSRRRKQKAIPDELFGLLTTTPTWVGPLLAVAAYVLFQYLIPLFTPSPKAGAFDLLRNMTPMFAKFAAGVVLLAWGAAEISKLFNRRLLDRQTGLESIRDISWQQFERLVSEAYRRQGYMAEVVGSASGDGGVDIELHGHGQKVLVQCKQWRAYKVGVTTIRELLGVVVSERADKGIVVTSGKFTQEAQQFARQNPQIELLNGPELAELIRGVQVERQVPITRPDASTPRCPACGAEMVLRTARRGQNAGGQFWGCPKFPACSGKRQV